MDFAALNQSGAGSGGWHKHFANILKHAMYDGAIKVFEDETGGAQRTEIVVPEGKVIVIKDFEKLPTLSQYKRIEVYSPDDEFLDALEIFPEDRMSGSSLLRVFYGRFPIGVGSGDLGMIIASKLTGSVMEPRHVGTSSVDDEVVTAIKKMLARKSV